MLHSAEMNRKSRKLLILFLIIICTLPLLACSDNKAEELYETAQFEELQNNREHAKQLYEKIIKKHPESAYAKKAEIRLSELN